jgi:16S rRNA (guanine(966)-N(2))-methyltransferase RsmD
VRTAPKGKRGRRADRPAGLGAVHIAAGRWKRRRLEVPEDSRPTGGRAREALFDILQKRIPRSRVLDLFAGSGAVGLEAVSRGALRAVLVERQPSAARRNVARLGAAREVELIAGEARAALADLAARGERFEIVFADPPYDAAPAPELWGAVAGLLAPGGTFVLQSDAGAPAPRVPETLLRADGRRPYGRNVFWFFRRVA